MDFFERTFTIHSRDVTQNRQLRLSAMLGFFQEASISHTENLGMGREKTLDRGLLWIITKQSAEIIRMPRYDETVTLRTWPGRTMRVFFPRYYEIRSGEDLLVRGCAVWMLLSESSRSFVFPDEYDIEIDGFSTGDELDIPGSLAVCFRDPSGLTLCKTETYSARFSQIDINGHVNNCRYFDLVDDILPPDENTGYDHAMIEAEYLKEIRLGDTVVIKAYQSEDSKLIEGESDQSVFRIRIKTIVK